MTLLETHGEFHCALGTLSRIYIDTNKTMPHSTEDLDRASYVECKWLSLTMSMVMFMTVFVKSQVERGNGEHECWCEKVD